MGPLIAGIIALLVDWFVATPYPIHLLLLIGGIVLVVYGIYVLLFGHTRTGRWHY
jgi:hypothetical protein